MPDNMSPQQALETLTRELALRDPEERLQTARAVAETAAVLLELIGQPCFDVAEALEQDLPENDAELERMLASGETPVWRLSLDLANIAGGLCKTNSSRFPENVEEWAAGVLRLREAATWPERGPAAGVRAGLA